MKEFSKELLSPKKIRFKQVYCEGNKYFSFVWCEDKNFHNVLYALDDNHETHTKIYELAVNSDIISENCLPLGGGIFDAKSGEYLRDSIQYGGADEKIFNAILRKFPSLSDCD